MEITRDNYENVSDVIYEITSWLEKHDFINWDAGHIDYDKLTMLEKNECWTSIKSCVDIEWKDYSDIWDNLNDYSSKCTDMDIEVSMESIQQAVDDKSEIGQYIEDDSSCKFDALTSYIADFYSRKYNVDADEVKKELEHDFFNVFRELDVMYRRKELYKDDE